MPRPVWKGAVSFGLVHVPVALYPASTEAGIDFDWLDRRTLDPVGYKRINKRTGAEIAGDDIVRGVKVDDGRYVVLGDDEIRAAYPKTTQTIEIESFVAPRQIPFTLLDRPYYLEPQPGGEKVYALLREALREAGVVGIARLVLHTREHLAVLLPVDAALMLNTLRWSAEVRPWDDLNLPPAGARAVGLKQSELKMAGQLIADMTEDWQPAQHVDHFTDAVQALVRRRAAAGQTEAVTPLEDSAEAAPTNVVELAELLQRSLRRRSAGGKAPAQGAKTGKGPQASPAGRPARKRA